MNFKTEFNLGDIAWYMRNNKPVEVVISAIHIFHVNTSQDQIKYSAKDAVNPVTWIDHQNLIQSILFKTKDELLTSL